MSRRTTIAGSLIILAVIVLAIAVFISRSGEQAPSVSARPWVNTPYRDLEDSTLMQKAGQNDTLAAMVLGSRYLDKGDTINAMNFLMRFNPSPQMASADLNYLSAQAFLSAGRDTAAIAYLIPLSKSKAYPNSRIDLANTYNKLRNYKQALAVYEDIDRKLMPGKDDSILVCKGMLGDTASGMKFAMRMMDEDKPVKAATLFNKFVSLSRGVSPTSWCYAAGMAFLQGNNPTRAAVYLENADADTSFAKLSYNLGFAYFRIEAFDSAASKYSQALQLGDSSQTLMHYYLTSCQRSNHPEKAYDVSLLGMKLYPESEEYYFVPANKYFGEKQYDKLLAFVTEAQKKVNNSYKIDSYVAAANYLLGNKETAMRQIDSLMEKYRFQAGALGEASQLFGISLGLKDVAEKMKQMDPAVNYPETVGFLNWYNESMSAGEIDTCKTILETWIENDTIKARRQIMVDLYNRDFSDSTQ